MVIAPSFRPKIFLYFSDVISIGACSCSSWLCPSSGYFYPCSFNPCQKVSVKHQHNCMGPYAHMRLGSKESLKMTIFCILSDLFFWILVLGIIQKGCQRKRGRGSPMVTIGEISVDTVGTWGNTKWDLRHGLD